METVTVTPEYQVVIPERIRKERKIRPGDRLAVIVKGGIVQLVPIRPIASSKGMIRADKVDFDDVRDRGDRI